MKPISWSELNMWETNQTLWHQTYVLGLRQPATPAMVRGTHLHGLLLEGKQDALDPVKYLPGEARIHSMIAREFDIIIPRELFAWEVPSSVDVDGIPTHGYWDGHDEENMAILELKTGARLWTQQQANEHGQLAFYALQHLLTLKTVPTMLLVSASTKSGKVVAYELVLSTQQLNDMRYRIKKAKEDMGDLWDKRVSKAADSQPSI